MSAPDLKKLISHAYPKTHLLNPDRVYVPYAQTDIRETFKRIRAEMATAKPAQKVRRIR